MTPREKAVSAIGHQPGCMAVSGPTARIGITFPDTCECYSDQLHVLIAAERGRLRKKHEWRLERVQSHAPDCSSNDPSCGYQAGCDCGGYVCGMCATQHKRAPSLPPGPCAEPLTPALAWELWVQICRVPDVDPELIEEQPGEWYATPGYEFGPQGMLPTPEEAVACLYLALAEAGLLRRDDAE